MMVFAIFLWLTMVKDQMIYEQINTIRWKDFMLKSETISNRYKCIYCLKKQAYDSFGIQTEHSKS